MRTWVQSLVGELIPHKPCGTTEKERDRAWKTETQTAGTLRRGMAAEGRGQGERNRKAEGSSGITYIWSLKIPAQTNLQNRYRVRDTENELMVTKVKGK